MTCVTVASEYVPTEISRETFTSGFLSPAVFHLIRSSHDAAAAAAVPAVITERGALS